MAGPSGCGKSTLIRALNGLIPTRTAATSAWIGPIGGLPTDVTPLKGLATVVGTVLQDPSRQLVASTVPAGADVRTGEPRRRPRRDRAAAWLQVVAASGLDPLMDRTTDELSGGEAQQVAIGGALMLVPRLLVLDEPLANLDPAAAQSAAGPGPRPGRCGTAVVIVEHRIEDVLEPGPTGRCTWRKASRATSDPWRGSSGRPIRLGSSCPSSAWLRRARGRRGAPGPRGSPGRPRPGPRRRLVWNGATWTRATTSGPCSTTFPPGWARHERVAVLGPERLGQDDAVQGGYRPAAPDRRGGPGGRRQSPGGGVAELATTFGYVFQNPSQMLFAATVTDELLFGPRNLGRDAATFDDLVATSAGAGGPL